MGDLTTFRAGDLLRVGPEASVQFIRPFLFRVIRVLDWTTYDGWIWLEGYQINDKGDAVARRTIFVQPAGLRTVPPLVSRPARAAARSVRDKPGRPAALGTPNGRSATGYPLSGG